MPYRETIREFIFAEDRPFRSCHASTLVVLPNDDIVAAWFAGTKEGAGDVAIWLSRRTGGKWSPPVKVADEEGVPHWNPVLFRRADGAILLFYKVGHKIPEWSTRVSVSTDNGETWQQPLPLVPGDVGGRGPVKNKPIVLSDGTWLAPASIEGEYWDAFVDISRDEGKTWTKSQLVPIRHAASAPEQGGHTADPVPETSFPGKGVIQPTLWESKPGTVHMLLRSTAGRICRSDSHDGGRTWSQAYPTSLPNNNSGIDLARLDSGTLVLAYNPVAQNWGPRTPLVLRFSVDNGLTWKDEIVVEDGDGEFSYPAVVAKGNEVFLTYTWKRERIAFCRFSLE